MKQVDAPVQPRAGFGTAPVFFTSISAILGAILFLRLGFATGTLGFWGAAGIILLGHLITIPTALAISEIATNTRVEGGGEYFIISRSFGLKIGSTIGLTLYFSQAISVAFYTIAFAESFAPLFEWWTANVGFELPRQVVSVPTLLLLAGIILRAGSGSGIKMLYVVNILLFISLALFFAGGAIDPGDDPTRLPGDSFGFFNKDQFFILFAICFPAFTGMTAGVGLSGDLKNPGRSIPLGVMGATLAGLLVYLLVVWQLSAHASRADLLADQLVMARVALFGVVIIPLGLAASTFSSAVGSIIVAPRTLQALAADRTFPSRRLNLLLAREKGAAREPVNATLLSFALALLFVLLGDVDTVAGVISMFFLITYGSLCLISFLNHFGSPPSYRPRFRSKWYLSLGGFLLSVWVMFMINALYTILAYAVLVLVYLFLEHHNKGQKGLVNIFKGALFQLNRRIQVFMQKRRSEMESEEWRPAAICISPHSLERDKVLHLMQWLSYQHGFGTYFHFIEGYFSKQTHAAAREVLARLIKETGGRGSTLYIDTMISPSYTSAIAQVIQAPSISGMENNMVVFEYARGRVDELTRILENINLARAGDYDVCIFAAAASPPRPANGIHVWIRATDERNTNLMILLGYIIMAHPDWRRSQIKLFIMYASGESERVKAEVSERVAAGRLPITLANIEIITLPEDRTVGEVVRHHSSRAGLAIVGFREEIIRGDAVEFFGSFDAMGDVLFVNAASAKVI
ncbi:MAG: amino acid permease [Odoribacteraceae bacterium]|jgi:amino acid transporter|nr:amino acid permease [Odoribacteraceae bacterium]